MSPDEMTIITKAPPLRKPAPKLTPSAVAERVADALFKSYPEAHQLRLIHEAFEKRLRESGKARILKD
jgi:hypothetical protein